MLEINCLFAFFPCLLSLQLCRLLNSGKGKAGRLTCYMAFQLWKGKKKTVSDWQANKNTQKVFLLSKDMWTGMWERKRLEMVKCVWLHTVTHLYIHIHVCICLCAQTNINSTSNCICSKNTFLFMLAKMGGFSQFLKLVLPFVWQVEQKFFCASCCEVEKPKLYEQE